MDPVYADVTPYTAIGANINTTWVRSFRGHSRQKKNEVELDRSKFIPAPIDIEQKLKRMGIISSDT